MHFRNTNRPWPAASSKSHFRELVRKHLTSRFEQFEPLNPFLEFGLYYEQVKRFAEQFSADNLRIYLYEEYKEAPTRITADIFRFLAVDSQFSPDISEKYLQTSLPRLRWISFMLKKHGVWSHLKSAIPDDLIPVAQKLAFKSRQAVELNSADRLHLCDYYREDIIRLSGLIKRDLHAWLA